MDSIRIKVSANSRNRVLFAMIQYSPFRFYLYDIQRRSFRCHTLSSLCAVTTNDVYYPYNDTMFNLKLKLYKLVHTL